MGITRGDAPALKYMGAGNACISGAILSPSADFIAGRDSIRTATR